MVDSLRRIREQPQEVWAVKLADRIANLDAPPPSWTPEKMAAYRSEAERILADLGAGHPALTKRLEQKIASYPAYR
jgi:(p)ppGpp synthase/HD superfamily hydrolase